MVLSSNPIIVQNQICWALLIKGEYRPTHERKCCNNDQMIKFTIMGKGMSVGCISINWYSLYCHVLFFCCIAYPSLTAWNYSVYINVCLALNNIFTPLFFFHLLTLYNFASKSVHNWVCDMILLLSFVYAVSSTSI